MLAALAPNRTDTLFQARQQSLFSSVCVGLNIYDVFLFLQYWCGPSSWLLSPNAYMFQQILRQRTINSYSLVDRNSLSHPDVLRFHVWAYKLADEFKSTSRYEKVLFSQVVHKPIVQKSLKPILRSRKQPRSTRWRVDVFLNIKRKTASSGKSIFVVDVDALLLK